MDSSSEEVKSDDIHVLLAIDLTQAVADEAISKKSNVIIAYHPFIFRGLKSITPADPQQKSLIKLIRNGISVYSPHTAVDSAQGGVNDFLADGISQGFGEKERIPIEANPTEEGCGMGRLVTLNKPAPLSSLVQNIKSSLDLEYIQVASGRNHTKETLIEKIAICAGSGGSVFRGINADLFYTGELSHHEALFFTENGSTVVACNHSNTERAFLKVLKAQLELELPGAEIAISESDKDPYQVW